MVQQGVRFGCDVTSVKASDPARATGRELDFSQYDSLVQQCPNVGWPGKWPKQEELKAGPQVVGRLSSVELIVQYGMSRFLNLSLARAIHTTDHAPPGDGAGLSWLKDHGPLLTLCYATPQDERGKTRAIAAGGMPPRA